MLDRGKFIRSKSEYEELMNSFESFIVDDFYKMNFENIFNYKNFDLKEFYQKWKKEVSQKKALYNANKSKQYRN